jgi:hypothetical protein
VVSIHFSDSQLVLPGSIQKEVKSITFRPGPQNLMHVNLSVLCNPPAEWMGLPGPKRKVKPWDKGSLSVVTQGLLTNNAQNGLRCEQEINSGI